MKIYTKNTKHKTFWILILSILILFFIFFVSMYGYYKYEEKKRKDLLKQMLLEEIFIKKQKQQELELKQKQQEQKLKQELENIYSLDLELDSSITKFVSSFVAFDDKSYIPANLGSISSDYVIDAKWWNQKLRKEAKEALEKMSLDFYSKFEKPLVVVSAYRSYAYQQGIKNRWCPDNLCAKAWYSEHQSWLAIDLWETTTKDQFLSKKHLSSYYDWLIENAHFYWFHNTYQKWLKIDTYEIEPWHWRYLWVDLATYLKSENITFAEFYNLKSKKEVTVN